MANEASRDPAWWPIVDRFYWLLLYLYPPEHRKQYANCMRQALRDRCREAGQGNVSPLRLLLGELLPDLARSLWEEHTMSFAGSSRRRVLGWVGALGVLAVVIPQAGLLGDWLYRHYSPRALAWQQAEDTKARQEHEISGFLAFLEAQRTPRAIALRLALDPGDEVREGADEFAPLPAADRVRMRKQVENLLEQPLDETSLAALASACRSSNACDDREIARRIREEQPDNGYAWLWSFDIARIAKDGKAMQLALQRMADAPRFDEPRPMLMRELILQRRAYGGDASLDAALFDRSLAFAGAPLHGVIETCGRMSDSAASVDACRRIGDRLSQSGGLRERNAGARLAYAHAATNAERDAAREQYRQAAWLAEHYPPRAWTSQEWHQARGGQWLAAWQRAGNEIDALAAWQESIGVARTAPRDYALPLSRQRYLVASGG